MEPYQRQLLLSLKRSLNSPNKKDKLNKSNFTFFERNINLNDKETSTNWLIFETPLTLYKENEIETYTVIIEDQKKKTKKVNTLLFKELIDENRL